MHDTVQLRKQWRQASLVKAFQMLDLRKTGKVPAEGVFAVLQYLRPHYPPAKIQLLYEKASVRDCSGWQCCYRSHSPCSCLFPSPQVDPRHHGSVEMADFVKIIDALNMRVMTSAPTLTSEIASLLNMQLHWRHAPLPLFAIITCALNTIVVMYVCRLCGLFFVFVSLTRTALSLSWAADTARLAMRRSR
jgi:hypothetical protein